MRTLRRRHLLLVLLAVLAAIAILGGRLARVPEPGAEGRNDRPSPPVSPAGRDGGTIASPPVEPPPPPWTVRGTVRGEEGEPVARARIDAERAGATDGIATVRSGADGTFRLEGLDAKPFRLEVLAEGYVTGWFRGVVRGEGATLDLRLRRGRSVDVRVVDGDGEPVAGAQVGLYPRPRVTFAGHYKTFLSLDRAATTDEDGRARLTGLAERYYQVAAFAHGNGSTDAFVLGGWSELVLTLGRRSSRFAYEGGPDGEWSPSPPPDMRKPEDPPPPPDSPAETGPRPGTPDVHAVRVEVRDADGSPLRQVRLEIRRGDEDEREWTGADGSIILFAERGEPFSILALPDGRPAVHVDSVAVPRDGPLVLRVPASLEVRGRVLDPDGAPVFGAWVEAARVGIGDLGEEEWDGMTGPDGRFAIPGPCASSYRVTVYHGAFGFTRATVAPGPGAAPVSLRLRPLVRLRGRVTDRAGAGVAGAWVELTGNHGGDAGTDRDGRFVLARLDPDEEAMLRVRHDDFLPVTVAPGTPGEPMAIRLSRGVALTLFVHVGDGRRFDVVFEDPATGERRSSGRGVRESTDGGVRCDYAHAPDGAVRLRVVPGEGEAQMLEYEAAEGESVLLRATLD